MDTIWELDTNDPNIALLTLIIHNLIFYPGRFHACPWKTACKGEEESDLSEFSLYLVKVLENTYI